MSIMSAASSTSGEILSRTDFFAGLSQGQLESVSRMCEVQRFGQGSQIYNIGESATAFYVLVDGLVKFTIALGKRNASAGDILRSGSVFGWAALTPTSKQRIATASCVTPCTILAINGDALLDFMERDHSAGFVIMKRLNLLITGALTAFVAG